MTVAALDTLAEAEAALAADFKAGTITETALAEGLAAAYNAAFGGASTPLEAALLAQQAISRLTAFVDDFLGNVGLRILGVLTSTSQLPATGNGIGDAFLVSSNLWVWTGSAWANAGPITGPAGQITSVTVAAGAPGTGASIVVGGTPSARTLALTIATGLTGASGTITSATATTGLPGTDVQLTLGGSASARTFAFVIPRGDTGQTGPAPNTSASVTMIATGGTATVTRSGPDTAPHFTFNIPRPADGDDGRQIELNASETHFQYRYAGDAAWTDLIALDAFTGATGPKGAGLEIAARGANLAARAAYDAEAVDFTFLDLETGLLYWRETSTPGVWSEPVTFGTELNDVLEALADLTSSAGVLVQTGPATFAKRAIGTATGTAIPDRDAADARYRKLSDQTPLADVAGLAAALADKADAGAVMAALAGKQNALGFEPAPAAEVDALALRVDDLEAAPSSVLTINGAAPDGAGNVVLNISAAGGLTTGDGLRILKALAELKGSKFGTLHGYFDDFADQTGIDAAASVNEVYDATNKGYASARIASTPASDFVPSAMTGASAPAGFAATSSSQFGTGQAAWHAFDKLVADSSSTDDAARSWVAQNSSSSSVANPQWLQIRGPTARMVTTYTIRARSDAGRMPRDWTLQGSNDGAAWTILDTVSAQTAWTSDQERTFAVDTPGDYSYYRINITAQNGSPTEIKELYLAVPATAETNFAMTLRPVAVSVPTAPKKLSLIVIARKGASTEPAANTEIIGKVSRNGGANWTTATLIPRESAAGNVTFEALGIDVTGQPSGSSILYEIDTLADAQYFVGAVGLFAEE